MRRILHGVTMTAVFLLMTGSAFAASGFEVGARGAYWFPKLSGNAQTNATGDTRFDFKDTLGVGDENIPFGEAFLRLGNTTLRVGYTQIIVRRGQGADPDRRIQRDDLFRDG